MCELANLTCHTCDIKSNVSDVPSQRKASVRKYQWKSEKDNLLGKVADSCGARWLRGSRPSVCRAHSWVVATQERLRKKERKQQLHSSSRSSIRSRTNSRFWVRNDKMVKVTAQRFKLWSLRLLDPAAILQ